MLRSRFHALFNIFCYRSFISEELGRHQNERTSQWQCDRFNQQ